MEGQLLLGFRRKVGRAVLNKSSLKKNKTLRLWHFLTGCKKGLVLVVGAEWDLPSFS